LPLVCCRFFPVAPPANPATRPTPTSNTNTNNNSTQPLQELELTTTKEDECASLLNELKGYYQCVLRAAQGLTTK